MILFYAQFIFFNQCHIRNDNDIKVLENSFFKKELYTKIEFFRFIVILVIFEFGIVSSEEPAFKCICTTSQPTYFCKCYSLLHASNLNNASLPEIVHSPGKKNENVNGVCLSFQPIGKFPQILQKFKKVKILRALKSSLKNVQFIDYPSLEEIDLRYNEISTINATNFLPDNQIKKLDLSHNFFTFFDHKDFATLKVLKILNLAWNKITLIKNSKDYFMPKLSILNLSGNLMKILQKNIFYPRSNLTEIDLNYNQIYEIDEGFIVFDEFEGDLIVHLQDNACIDKSVSLSADSGQTIISYLTQECNFNANKFRFRL